jgi:hypothetical protein
MAFEETDRYIKVFGGQEIMIEADSAYILNTELAQYFNSKVIELEHLQNAYNDLIDQNVLLRKELLKIRDLLDELSTLVSESKSSGNEFTMVITDLMVTAQNLEHLNLSLEENNTQLQKQIQKLQQLNKELKKKTRGIWWSGVKDKIVVAVGGILLGITIGQIL